MRHQDWIGQDIDARGVPHEEAWRFFTSGQFTQLRVVSADLPVGKEASRAPSGAASEIELWEILFYLTELVELAARLALSHAGGDQMTVNASLYGLENRQATQVNTRYIRGLPQVHARYIPDRATSKSDTPPGSAPHSQSTHQTGAPVGRHRTARNRPALYQLV
jgi:hypothetical protein